MQILVVDDMAECREVSCLMLQLLGYRTVGAATYREALTRAAEIPVGDELVVLTDIELPEMGGVELAELIQQQRPGTKVVFTSGNPRDYLIGSRVLDPSAEFLAKPYTRRDLVEVFERATQHPFPFSNRTLTSRTPAA